MKYSRIIIPIIMSSFFLFSSCERKSGRKNVTGHTQKPSIERKGYIANDTKGKTIVKMETEFGVKYIWIEINVSG